LADEPVELPVSADRGSLRSPRRLNRAFERVARGVNAGGMTEASG